MHLIDGQAQIQWSVALQLSLCGHLATVLTKCTLQLSLTGYSAEAWANEAWAKVAAKSLTLPSRPPSAALALITQSPFSAVAQMCVRVRVCVYYHACSRLIGGARNIKGIDVTRGLFMRCSW